MRAQIVSCQAGIRNADDSNIIIYAAQSQHSSLRQLIAENAPFISAVSYVEVLGYHKLLEQDRQYFEVFFAAATILPVSDDVIKHAVRLKQTKKMTLGDSLIAGTALTHNLTLVTRNTKDFDWISGLPLLNPFTEDSATT